MSKINIEAQRGLREFEEYYKKIWDNYRKYGDIVLKSDLVESERDVSEVLKTAKDEKSFHREMFSLWKKKYQIVIDNCLGIAKAAEIIKNDNSNKLTEENLHQKIYIYEEREQRNHNIYVSKRFFKKIIESNTPYIYANECIYIVNYGNNGYNYISIEKILQIKDMLKDN